MNFARTDDPVKDAELYLFLRDLAETRFVERTPKCVCCRKHVAEASQTVWFAINELPVCEECIRDGKYKSILPDMTEEDIEQSEQTYDGFEA